MPKYKAIYVCQNQFGGPSIFTPTDGPVCSNPPDNYPRFLGLYVPEYIMKDWGRFPLRNEAPPGHRPIKGTPDGKPLDAERMMLLYAAIALQPRKQ
jgi:hypothetical protein